MVTSVLSTCAGAADPTPGESSIVRKVAWRIMSLIEVPSNLMFYKVGAQLSAGVSASPINTIDRLVNDPHIAGAREVFVDIDHPVAGKTKLTDNHIKLGTTPARTATPAPLLGQHNEAVHAGLLGVKGEQLASLRRTGVI